MTSATKDRSTNKSFFTELNPIEKENQILFWCLTCNPSYTVALICWRLDSYKPRKWFTIELIVKIMLSFT
jgi:hypothetical protein